MVDVIYIKSHTKEDIIPMCEQTQENSETLCKKFTSWLELSQPGDKFCYYIGPYVAGKLVGRLASDAYKNGLVILYQKKDGNKFGYWAQRKRLWEA